tara:strand:- start:947 stop:1105 length:159 start_codon:yes stop_codon:yes gene_type:complete
MSSDIDATKPADNVQVSKQDMRDNFLAAKDEIEELQRLTGIPWQIAIGVLGL